MNSFRFLERGIEAEIERQAGSSTAAVGSSRRRCTSTRAPATLTALRSKEYSHDYRYFPEPDLVPLEPTAEMIEAARAALPELPAERRERYATELGLAEEAARQLAFDAELGAYFERVTRGVAGAPCGRVVANWVTGELAAGAQEAAGSEQRPDPSDLGATIEMVQAKRVSHAAGRRILRIQVAEGGDPAEIAEREGLGAIEDSGELEAIVAAPSRPTPTPPSGCARATRRRSGRWSGSSCARPRAEPTAAEVTRLINAKLGLN